MASYRQIRQMAVSARQSWMSAFERGVTQARPDLAGRIDWDTAAHLYNSHHAPEAAVRLYLASREREGK